MTGSAPNPSWTTIISRPADLITTPEAIRTGFFEQAEAKVGMASPLVDRSSQLLRALQTVADVDKLLEIRSIYDDIVMAAGFSQKARKHFTTAQLSESVKRVIQDIYTDCVTVYGHEGEDAVQDAFHGEIVARYLLTAGAMLDGQMRNWTGAHAQDHLVVALLKALERRGKHTEYAESEEEESGDADPSQEDDSAATNLTPDEAVPEIKRSKLEWPGRLLLFNVKPKPRWKGKALELNNIDMVLLRVEDSMNENALKQDATKYLACGELKGGIDPAGADEHWKTARSALNRIRIRFSSVSAQSPQLFFVGAVIVNKMAGEIFEDLTAGDLSYAANLTNGAQLTAFADWLVSL